MLCSSASQISFLDHSGCRCTNFCAPDCFSDCGAGWGFRHYTEFSVESRAFECHLLWPQATTRCDQMQIIQIWLVVVECCWCLADPVRHVDHCIQDLYIYVDLHKMWQDLYMTCIMTSGGFCRRGNHGHCWNLASTTWRSLNAAFLVHPQTAPPWKIRHVAEIKGWVTSTCNIITVYHCVFCFQ